MSDIVLSAGVRSNLLQLQQTSDLITQTQTRLATGKRVNSALDNPINYFTAQGLTVRANDLNSLLDSMSTGINTIQAANNGITRITKLVQSAQALVSQAQQTTDTKVRATLATQFRHLLAQIDQLAGDSGFNGVNLLGGNTLTVTLNETGASTVVIAGVNDTAAGALSIIAMRPTTGRLPPISARPQPTYRRAGDAAVAVPGTQLQPADRASPPGFHQGDDQHAEYRLRQPHAGRQQRRGRQPSRLADPPATVDHRIVAGGAGRPERAATVPVTGAAADTALTALA